MNPYLLAVLWAAVGAAAGWGMRWASLRLARLEGLESGSKPWQRLGPPILCGVIFAAFGYEFTSLSVLIVRSVFVLVLVQVIFFDFEHHLILDRVMFPAMLLAIVVAIVGKPWWPGSAALDRPWLDSILTGLGAGLLFLLIALIGSAIFKAEALGFGDVKLALFMGLLLGELATINALFYGVLLAAIGAVAFIVMHRSMKGNIAYGPYLAAGALIVLFQLP